MRIAVVDTLPQVSRRAKMAAASNRSRKPVNVLKDFASYSLRSVYSLIDTIEQKN